MISHTQLSSNRLQKQLFIVFLLSDERRRSKPSAFLLPLLLSSYAEKARLCKNFVDNQKILSAAAMASATASATTSAATAATRLDDSARDEGSRKHVLVLFQLHLGITVKRIFDGALFAFVAFPYAKACRTADHAADDQRYDTNDNIGDRKSVV